MQRGGRCRLAPVDPTSDPTISRVWTCGLPSRLAVACKLLPEARIASYPWRSLPENPDTSDRPKCRRMRSGSRCHARQCSGSPTACWCPSRRDWELRWRPLWRMRGRRQAGAGPHPWSPVEEWSRPYGRICLRTLNRTGRTSYSLHNPEPM